MLLSNALLALAYAQTLVITDVTILDSRNASRTPNRDVYIKDGRIRAITPANQRKPDAKTRQIPGKGKFLLPGLWDMHVHVGEIEKDWFDLYLANGITGLREMAAGSNNIPKQKQYVADIEAGKRTGPRLFWTTEPIDRFDGKYKSPLKVSSPDEARAAVRYVKSLGSNYVKVYNGLSRPLYIAIVDEAKKQGMSVTGHIPDVISVLEASRLGQKSMEHLDGFLIACSAKEAAARYLVRINLPWRMLLDSFDAKKAAALFGELKKNQTWVTPTLMIHRFEAFAKGSLEDSDTRMAYVRRDYLAEWRGERNKVVDQPLRRQLFDKYLQLTGMLHHAGVSLLAGTDTPYPGCIPGFALHDELELLVQAGLPPSAAIRAATWNPAEYFGITQDYGSVEQGKIADILLLNKDPFLDIRHIKDIQAVFVRGKVLLRNDLDSMLANVRQAVKTPSAPSH